MGYTFQGTKVLWEWCPVAMANGIEWSTQRAGHADRFDCMYRRGHFNKLLWHFGAFLAVCRVKLPR